MLFHAGLLGLVGGFIGVDVFFVISGFLITGLLLREHDRSGRINLLKFYARRVRRLLPAATVVLVATLFVSLNLVAPLDRPAVGLDAAAAAMSIGNVRFAMAAGDYFTSVAAPSPFLHFWSLAVEEQFYLIWPALILLVARGVHARRRVLIALAGVAIASFAANLFLTDAAANWAFYSLPTRAWELGLGGLLAAGSVAVAKVPDRIVGIGGWVGLAAIGVATFAYSSGLAYPGIAAVLPAVGTVLLLAGGTRRLGPGRLMSLRPLRFLGAISYSLYLVHWPILVLAPFVLGAPADGPTLVGLVALSIAVAYVCQRLVETPFRTGLPRLTLQPGRTVSIGLASIAAVVALAAGPSISASPTDTAIAAGPDAVLVAEAEDEPWVDEVDQTMVAPTEDNTAPGTAAPTTTPGTPTVAPTVAPTATPVRDIANTGSLPSDVKPSLSRARGDEERLRADGCLAFEGVTNPPNCIYGNKSGDFTVALVGDSHAAHWFPALERLAKHEGWKIVTFVKVSCPFIDMPVRNLALKREYRECADFNDATIARLKALKPDLTLVSMSRMAIHPMTAGDDTIAARGAAIARMIAKVPGKTAVIVDTPYAKRDVPGCLSAHQDNADACSIPPGTAFAGDFGKAEAVAATASGAGIIDLTAKFVLDTGPVPVVINGMIVYRDECHMTATFSKALGPALGAAIQVFLAN